MKNNNKGKKPVLKKIVAGAVVAGALAVGGIATSASFSDSGTTAVKLNSGGIDIKLKGDDAASSKAASIDLGQLKPGDTFTKTITVYNDGTMPLKYTTTSATVGDTVLTDRVTVKVDDTTGTTKTLLPATTKVSAINIATAQTVAGGTSQTLTLTGTWANGTTAVDNPAMNKNATVTITFNATS